MVKAKRQMALGGDSVGTVVTSGVYGGAVVSYWQVIHIEVDTDGFRTATMVKVEPISYSYEIDGSVYWNHYFKPVEE